MSGNVSLSGPTMVVFARQVAAVLQTLPAGFGQLGFVKQGANIAIAADGTLSVFPGAGTGIAAEADLAALQAVVSALQIGRLPLGTYNAATNTPNLSTVAAPGSVYDVAEAGTPNIPGVNVPCVIGDQLVANAAGTAWFRIPFGGTYLPDINPAASGVLSVGAAGVYGSALPLSLVIEDTFGNVSYYLDESGAAYSINVPATAGFAGLTIYEQAGLPEGAAYWQDQFGNVSSNTGVGASVASAQSGTAASSTTFGQQDIENSDLYGYATSLRVRDQADTTAQRPTAQLNVGAGYGQSEGEGYESGPIFADPTYDAVMYGGSVRGADVNGGSAGAAFTPVTDTTIRPIAATAQNLNTGALIPNRNGGFQAISSLVLASGVITLGTGATANMMQVTAGTPPAAPTFASTPVGGTGQPALDFTQILKSGDTFWLSCLSGTSNDTYLVAGTVTATTISLMYGSDSLGQSGTFSNVNLIVTNNGLGFIGQEPITGALSTLSRLMCGARYVESDPTKQFLGVNTAVGSQAAAALESGATPNLYGALISFLTQVKAKGTTRLIFEHWMQGGNDASAGTTEPVYDVDLTQLVTTRRADVMALLGQPSPHLFFITQLAGVSVSGNQAPRFVIGCAQADWINSGAVPSAYMIGPYNVYPGYGPHLSGNGERWLSEQIAKVAFKILVLNQGWRHLQPIKAVARGSQVILTFYVPEPPLRGGNVYHNMVEVTPAGDPTLGFAVTDATGANAVTSVVISDCTIVLNLARTLVPAAAAPFFTVTGGAATGYVLLKDSDPWVSKLSYVYQDFYGFNPVENFPELVGLPYDMSNYCPLFSFNNGVMG